MLAVGRQEAEAFRCCADRAEQSPTMTEVRVRPLPPRLCAIIMHMVADNSTAANAETRRLVCHRSVGSQSLTLRCHTFCLA